MQDAKISRRGHAHHVSGHPLNRFATLIRKYASTNVESLGKLKSYEQVRLGGIQTSVRIRPFKNGVGLAKV